MRAIQAVGFTTSIWRSKCFVHYFIRWKMQSQGRLGLASERLRVHASYRTLYRRRLFLARWSTFTQWSRLGKYRAFCATIMPGVTDIEQLHVRPHRY